ncbi:restriction endonuclease subunit S [Flavobacterium sp. EDS]|uniref:restriction endonuclease subunit S n=1 Tax=Flavobacterium sp. EDS TaxID=2897328 RepID=UPI001E4C1074|nr:restriction endonuclease subunit S [Flavobacterium sp. EDS]MCD0475257.1 restriction endonuclease subunit S [Flavobacterium sp. EDS]
MSNWKQVSDFVSFTTKGITPKYVKNSSIIVLNQKCIRNNRIDYSFSQYTDDTKQIADSKFVQRGDILVNSTGTGTAGRCAFVKELPENHLLITDSHILILRCHSYYEAQCLSYLLFSFEKTLMSFMTGSSGQSELDKVVLLNIKIKLPNDSNKQKKIARVLSDLDTKIELNSKINAELEAMTKTLYNYWFVQFDFPDANGKPYKTSGGKMVWNAELKREIPEGWESGYLNDLYNFQYGSGNTNPDDGGEYPIYGSNGVIGGYGEYNNEDAPVIGHIGNNCGSLVYAYGKHYVTYNGVMCKIKKPFDKFFGYCTLLSKDLKTKRRGSSQPFISYDLLNDIDIVIPDARIMKMFCDLIVPSYENVISKIKENQELASLRDWLLAMLMNGQITVTDVEEKLDMVAENNVEYKKN